MHGTLTAMAVRLDIYLLIATTMSPMCSPERDSLDSDYLSSFEKLLYNLY